ncbi:MAG: DUF4388 domain-containing protein [Nitrospinae bacterium]|nr:DUF4388 domain-containing protein [Nitrospinota bacterium]
MALQGNLDDFNILNILQMIKLEGKTGRLTVSDKDDLVRITFDNGAIIFAEGPPAKDGARIESALLGNKLIAQADWDEVKREHEDKLKPYFELLAKKIQPQLVIELLKRQVIDNVYYGLRWKTGNYEFSPMKSIKYNDKIMTPMDVDALLMEGCRIADEWPRVVASIPPMGTFITKNILGEGEEDDSAQVKTSETGGDFKGSLEYELLAARGVNLRDSEINILSVIGKGTTIQNAMDSARQGHFTSLEAAKNLLQMGIIKPTAVKKTKAMAADYSGNTLRIGAIAVLALLIAGGIAWQVISWSQIAETQKQGVIKVKAMQAHNDLREIEHALKVYNAVNGSPPPTLQAIEDAGLVDKGGIVDPWGSPYQYTAGKEGFTLYSNGPDAFLATDNIYPPGQPAPSARARM